MSNPLIRFDKTAHLNEWRSKINGISSTELRLMIKSVESNLKWIEIDK